MFLRDKNLAPIKFSEETYKEALNKKYKIGFFDDIGIASASFPVKRAV